MGDGLGLHLIARRFEGGRLRKFFEFATGAESISMSRAEPSRSPERAQNTLHNPGTAVATWVNADTHAHTSALAS